jgi:hypothetical protein
MMTRALVMVHWPGQDTPACDEHAGQLATVAEAMGFALSATPISPDLVLECENCRRKREKAAA